MTTSPYTTRQVSHEEAGDIARRLINGSFRRDGERLDDGLHPRFSIPTRPDHDDDCLILAYVRQQQAAEAVLDAALETIRSDESRLQALNERAAALIAEARKDSVGAQAIGERALADAIWLAIRDDEDRCDMELDDIPEGHPAWKAARAVVSLLERATS